MFGRRPVRRSADLAPRHLTVMLILAMLAALASVAGTSIAAPTPVEAATRTKVVVVVGPTHGSTTRYIQRARVIAQQARRYGASVTELYTPRATWARVRAAAKGANILVYLGHGNGSPSPYGPLNRASMNGLGLNPASGARRTSPVKYYGEAFMSQLRLAPNAVILLNHLCYASGNGEPGSREPGWRVARQRVDNFAAGFIRAGAGAVIADGHTNLAYELHVLLGTKGDLVRAWRRDPAGNGHERRFSSVRSRGFSVLMDPEGKSTGFYRSLTTRSGFSSRLWHRRPRPAGPAPFEGITTTALKLRASASMSARTRLIVPDAARLVVAAGFVTDRQGRVWAKVKTVKSTYGYVAGWLLDFRGTVLTNRKLVLHTAGASTSPGRGIAPKGSRFTIVDSHADRGGRVWFKVRASTGIYGWIAGWYTRP